MKIIRRHFATLATAEAFQDSLYDRYDSVACIGWPLFSEDGVYSWRVA